MEMFEIFNGSQCAHDIFLVNKAGAMEYITDRSYPLIIPPKLCKIETEMLIYSIIALL